MEKTALPSLCGRADSDFLQRIFCYLNDIPFPPLLSRPILLPRFSTLRDMPRLSPFPTLILGSFFIQENK